MAYADFGYYQDFFLGKLITDMEQFRTLSERASEYIDKVTFYRINTEVLKDKSVEKLIKKCTCAIAEAYYIYDSNQLNDGNITGAKTSEKIGQYSVSWANPLDSLESLTGGNFPSYLRKLCIRYLGTTGLMYRGVCY
ncbi:MAG: hypothetical protein ACI4WH_05580 [Oscillospiraceae bacterium]